MERRSLQFSMSCSSTGFATSFSHRQIPANSQTKDAFFGHSCHLSPEDGDGVPERRCAMQAMFGHQRALCFPMLTHRSHLPHLCHHNGLQSAVLQNLWPPNQKSHPTLRFEAVLAHRAGKVHREVPLQDNE